MSRQRRRIALRLLLLLQLWALFISCLANEQSQTGVQVMSNGSYSNASHLLEQLLQGYDIRLRPGFGGEALRLEMDIVIASFDSVSEVNMDYTVTMYLHQYWRDERLAWAKEGYGNESMTLSGDFSKSIWVPDTFLANDKNSFLHDVTETNKMLRLYSDGYIAYGMRFTSTLACHMNLRYYPLDSQDCTVEIESYGYTTSEVLMMWREGSGSVRGVTDAEIPQFSILNYETQNRSVTTSTGSYQRLSLVFKLRRNIGYFIFQTYLPCILIVMLSWVSFWINHEATSARVALGITTVLTMTTISTGVRQSLPRISYVKSIDIYLVMCFVFVFAALLEYAAVNYTYWGSRSKKKNRSEMMADQNEENEGAVMVDWNPLMQSTTGGRFSGGGLEMDELKEIQESPPPPAHMPEPRSGRMSPLPSLLPQSYNPSNHVDSLGEPDIDFPDYPRVQSAFKHPGSSQRLRFRGPGVRSNRRNVHSLTQRRANWTKSLVQWKRRAKAAIPKIRDVNMIDKWSRIIFPVSFILFNAFYWTYYAILAPRIA